LQQILIPAGVDADVLTPPEGLAEKCPGADVRICQPA